MTGYMFTVPKHGVEKISTAINDNLEKIKGCTHFAIHPSIRSGDNVLAIKKATGLENFFRTGMSYPNHVWVGHLTGESGEMTHEEKAAIKTELKIDRRPLKIKKPTSGAVVARETVAPSLPDPLPTEMLFKSTAISRIAKLDSGKVVVTFINRGMFMYNSIPDNIYEQFVAAYINGNSIGKIWNKLMSPDISGHSRIG
jgi:hypothetical protein